MVCGVVTIVFFSVVTVLVLLVSPVFVVSVFVVSVLLLLPQDVRRKAAQNSSMIDRRTVIDFDFNVNKKGRISVTRGCGVPNVVYLSCPEIFNSGSEA